MCVQQQYNILLWVKDNKKIYNDNNKRDSFFRKFMFYLNYNLDCNSKNKKEEKRKEKKGKESEK